MRTFAVLTAALLLAMAAQAEVLPIPGQVDRHIQTVEYNAEDVVRLRVASGYQLSLQFAPDERVESVAVGETTGWQVTPNKRGDLLFVKLGQAVTRTNMMVATDARTYVFLLEPADQGASDLPFVVRFRYPVEVVHAVPASQPPGRYVIKGDKAVRPASVSDDGQRTTIAWRADQRLPAVFAEASDGQETLVNGQMQNGALVLDTVAPRLLFRLNKQVAQAERVDVRRKER